MAATDYQSLLSSANVPCYANLSPGIQQILELALLQIIANNIGSAASGAGGLTCGNYAGGQPTYTPSTGCGQAVDTSTGQIWYYWGGSWH